MKLEKIDLIQIINVDPSNDGLNVYHFNQLAKTHNHLIDYITSLEKRHEEALIFLASLAADERQMLSFPNAVEGIKQILNPKPL